MWTSGADLETEMSLYQHLEALISRNLATILPLVGGVYKLPQAIEFV